MTWPSISVLVLLSQNKAGSRVGPFAIHRLNITCSFFGPAGPGFVQKRSAGTASGSHKLTEFSFLMMMCTAVRKAVLSSSLCFLSFRKKWINSKFYGSQTLKKNEHESVPFFRGFFSRHQTESSRAPVEAKTTRRELQSPTGHGYPLMERKNWMTTWSWQTLFVYILELIIGCFLFLCFFGKYRHDDLLVDIVSTKTDLWSLFWLTFVVWFLEVWVSLDAWGILRDSLLSDVIFGVRSRMKGCCWHIGKKQWAPHHTKMDIYIYLYIYSWFWNNHFENNYCMLCWLGKHIAHSRQSVFCRNNKFQAICPQLPQVISSSAGCFPKLLWPQMVLSHYPPILTINVGIFVGKKPFEDSVSSFCT